ncbi:hypothetical protein [Rhizomonospora bruguierae]|uniref:hypothetical protein n=1 Tax=Rhizomonospora bruguierae TaxID=1581705 RepID=UPI001BCE084D|nr:hypothetical protein [Micromonospora sp. NBRC 107566]
MHYDAVPGADQIRGRPSPDAIRRPRHQYKRHGTTVPKTAPATAVLLVTPRAGVLLPPSEKFEIAVLGQ